MSTIDTDTRRCMERNLRLILAHALFLNIAPIIPVIIPYYQQRLGLNFHQFMIGEAFFSAIVILMEVPTGWLSDIWTRKSVTILGTVVSIIGWLMLWQARGFWTAFAAQGMIGVAISLLSGTNSAMLYESLLSLGRESEFRKREGLRSGIGLYACGFSSLGGGFLYARHPDIPVIATWATTFVALLFACLLAEPVRHKESARRHPVADMVATLRYALRGHADIAAIILFSAVLFAVTKMMFWSQQPYFEHIGLPVKVFGLFTASGMIMGGMGGHFSHLIHWRGDRDRGNLSVLKLCFAFAFCACAITALFPSPVSAVFLLSGSLIFGLGFPRVQETLSRNAPPARRATILSTASLMTHVVCVPLLVLTGWTAAALGIRTTLVMLAALLIFGGGGAYLLKRQVRQKGDVVL